VLDYVLINMFQLYFLFTSTKFIKYKYNICISALTNVIVEIIMIAVACDTVLLSCVQNDEMVNQCMI